MASPETSAYPLPKATGESEQETARIDAHQNIWIQELGSLSLVTLPSGMKTVVDLGCGTGIWSRTMAVQYPKATFIGVDVNPPIEGELETAGNANCRFVKANVEDEWSFVDGPGTVDYMLARMLTTGVRNWRGLYDKAFRAIRPGGYFESQETFIGLLSDDNEAAKGSPLITWFNRLADFASRHGIETTSVDTHGQRLEKAGFEIIAEKPIKWYFDASRPEMKGKEQISHMVTDQISDILDTMTPKIFARSTSMSLEEGQKLAADARVDLMQNSGRFGYHTRYHIRVAQKPL